MSRNIKQKLAKRLKELRKKYGYTQQKLAELSEVDYKHIQRLESKNPPNTTINTLEKIAKAFRISLSELVNFK